MAAVPQSVRAVIENGGLCHMTTLNRDGSPQVTLVWIGVDGDELVTAHLNEHIKIRNVRRDPRVALSIATDRRNAIGLEEYVVIYGKARVVEGGAPELLQRLAHVYLGPDVKFPTIENPPPGYVMRITPDRYTGNGPWTV